MRYITLLLTVTFLFQCRPKSKEGQSAFEGNYIIGDNSSAIVIPLINNSYEIDFQMFGDPEVFYFDKLDSAGYFVYQSEEGAMSIVMKPDHLEGIFYEINEPPASIRKEQ